MKKIVYMLLISGIIAFSACASIGVSTQGAGYFVGKSESALSKYFGYEGEIVDGEEEYDKVLYFTNRVVRFMATKQKVTRYKKSESNMVFRVFFAEFNDGCLHWLGGAGTSGRSRSHYEPNVTGDAYIHNNNDNALVKNEVNKFYSEAKRLNAVDSRDQQDVFNKTNIGSWYFVYNMEDTVKHESHISTYAYGGGVRGLPGRSESYMWHDYRIFRIDIKADDRVQTESYTPVTYVEYYDSFYDSNGKVISEAQAEAIQNDYIKKGFEILSNEEGISVIASIKDGKVVKVE
jgi:hypothetical protein